MVEPRTGEAGEARNADDRLGVGGNSAARKISAQNKERANQADRHHQAVRAERQRANVNEGIQPGSRPRADFFSA